MSDEQPDEDEDEIPPDEHVTDPYYGDEMQPIPEKEDDG